MSGSRIKCLKAEDVSLLLQIQNVSPLQRGAKMHRQTGRNTLTTKEKEEKRGNMEMQQKLSGDQRTGGEVVEGKKKKWQQEIMSEIGSQVKHLEILGRHKIYRTRQTLLLGPVFVHINSLTDVEWSKCMQGNEDWKANVKLVLKRQDNKARRTIRKNRIKMTKKQRQTEDKKRSWLLYFQHCFWM